MPGVDSEEKRILELMQVGFSLQTIPRSLKDTSADGVLLQIIECYRYKRSYMHESGSVRLEHLDELVT